VRGIVEGVQVQGERGLRSIKGRDELIDQHVPQPPEIGNRDGVLEPGERGLAGQVLRIVRKTVGDQLEDRITAEGVVIVLVLVEPFAVSRSA
jgi:hypothetical protein